MNRPLTDTEKQLVVFMLENGDADAKKYLSRIDSIRVTQWVCDCGCASFKMVFEGESSPTGTTHIIADFELGSGLDMAGAFLFEYGGVLAGFEVYGMAKNAPTKLPKPNELRPLTDEIAKG